MSTTINLGPSNVNRPLEEEKIAIRDSLDLGSAALLYGSFNPDGDAITFADDGLNPSKSLTIRIADLEGTLATKLKDSQRFQLSGGSVTSSIVTFDGTADVILNANLIDNSVTREKIADGAIVASKIVNGAITPAKLSTGAPSWDSATTYLNRALELGNSIVVDTDTYIDFHSVRANAGSDLTDYDARLIRWAGVDGKLDLINTGTGTLGFTANNYSLKTIGNATDAITIPNTGDITINRSISIGTNTFKGNATSANTAARLTNEVTISLSGVISGDAKFTGATGSTTPSITTTFANTSSRVSSTSLNDITSTGFYRGDSTNTDRPVAITTGNYDILHMQSSATAASQLLFASVGQAYWRIRNGASWGAWNNIIDNTNIPNASSTIKGIVELATDAETIAGTSTTLAVTPASLVSLTATTDRAGLVKLSESDMLSLAEWTAWSLLDNVAATPKAVAARILAIPPTSTAIPGGDAGGDLTGVYPNPSIRTASTEVAGKIEISTNTEALNGASTTLAVTPANLKHVLDNSSSSASEVNKIVRRNASNSFAVNEITSSAISIGTGVSPTAPITIKPKTDANNIDPYKNSLHIYNPETETTTAGTVSINGTTNVITVSTNIGLANNREIVFTGLTNTTGIVTGVSYFVRDFSGSTFKISKNIGGVAIDIITTGTATGNATWRSARQNSIISVATSGLDGGDPFVSFDITSEAGWSAGVDNTDANKFKIASDYNDLSNDTRVTITSDGKVGIGTTIPSEQLEVVGTIMATGTVGFKGNLTGNVIGDLDGNAKTSSTTATAETANKLKTAINIVFTGDVAGTINAFDGSASVSNTLTIASDAVVSAKIKDGAVTASKLSTGGPAWGGIGSGSFNISQPALELGLGITANAACLIDFHSSTPTIDHDARILRNSGVNGNLDIINIGTGHINISSGGRVGINKSSPEEIFHVNGPIFLEGGTANTGLLTVDANNRTNTYAVFGSNGSSSDWAYLRQIGGNNNLTISLDLHDDSSSGTGGQGFKIRTIASSAAGATDPAPIDRFSIDGNGDIGINSTATRGKLTVVDDDNSLTGSASTLALSVRGTSQGEKPNLSFYSTFMATADNGPRRTADIVAGYNGGAWGNEYLTFNVGGSSDATTKLTTERMRVTAAGFVGIGTNAPTSMLHVNGTITANAFSGPLTGNVTGNATSATLATKASTLSQNGGSGGAMTFNWAQGQGVQPTWLWGGNDGSNHYVYNPSNFNVNYATSSGYIFNSSLATNGNQVNSGTGELALNYQKSDATFTNFIDTTIFNGKRGLVTKFYGNSGYQYNTGSLEINNGSPTIFLRDTDNRSAMIHVNNNEFMVLRGKANNSTEWESINSRWPMVLNLETNNATFGGTGNFLGGVTIDGGDYTNKYNANQLTFADSRNGNRYFMGTRGTKDSTNANWKFYYYNTEGGVDRWPVVMHVAPSSLNSNAYSLALKDDTIAVTVDNNVGIGTADPKQKLQVEGNVAIRGVAPTLGFIDTTQGTYTGDNSNTNAYIHVNNGGFHLLTGNANDTGTFQWDVVANGRWPLYINLNNNNAEFGGDVNAISFTANNFYGNARSSNQLQSFTADNFTDGNHYIKAIRESGGWWTRLKTCGLNGGATTNQVRVGYADYAGDYPNRYFIPHGSIWTVQESSGKWGNMPGGSAYYTTNNAYIDFSLSDLAGAGFLYNGANYAIFVEVKRYNGDLLAQEGFYPTGNSIGRTRVLSNINSGEGAGGGTNKATYTDGVHIQIRDHHSGKMSAIWGIDIGDWFSKENQINF